MNLLSDFVNSLRCQLCSKVLNNPNTFGTCGHTFCLKCVISTLEGVGIATSQCPTCGQPGWKKDLKSNYQVKNAVEHLGRLITTLCRPDNGASGNVECTENIGKDARSLALHNECADAKNQNQEDVSYFSTLADICLEQLCPEILCTRSQGLCADSMMAAGDCLHSLADLKEEVALLEAAIQLCDEIPVSSKPKAYNQEKLKGSTLKNANQEVRSVEERTHAILNKRDRCWNEEKISSENQGASRLNAKRRHLSNQYSSRATGAVGAIEEIAREPESSRFQNGSRTWHNEEIQTIPFSLVSDIEKMENTLVIPDSQEICLPLSQSLMPLPEIQVDTKDSAKHLDVFSSLQDMPIKSHRSYSAKKSTDGINYRSQSYSASQGRKSLRTPKSRVKDIRALLETHKAAQSAMRLKALHIVIDSDTLNFGELRDTITTFKSVHPSATFSSEVTEQTTHVIIKTDARLIVQTCGTTYLQGLALGCWLVSPSWLEACVEARARVHEHHFEVQACNLRSPNLQGKGIKGPERSRSLTARGERLLNGRRIFASSTADATVRTQLCQLVKLAGGTAIENSMVTPYGALKGPTPDCDLVILTDDSEEAKACIQHGYKYVLRTSWLMDSVACARCLDTEQYRWREDLDPERFEMATSVL